MAALKIGHGFSKLVEQLGRDETLAGCVRPVAVDSELVLSVLRGEFIENTQWRNTVRFLRENRVKTFIVSNCTDSRQEREVLLSHTQQHLQKFAAKQGCTFTFLDYWTGMSSRLDMTPKDWDLVSSELDSCLVPSSCSLGPVAIVLHTETYGDPVLPVRFVPKHFKWLLEASQSVGIDTRTIVEWFSLDDQSSPPVFEMKDISEIYSNFRSLDSDLPPDVVAEASALWQTTRTNLTHEITAGTKELVRKNVLTKEHLLRTNQSIFEVFVERVLKERQAKNKCVIYSRKFDKIITSDPAAGDYLDFDNGLVVPAGQRKAEKLFREIKMKMPNKLIHRKPISWKPGGITAEEKQHKTYLSYVQTQSYLDLTRRISAAKLHQQQLLSFFKSDSLQALFLECSAQLLHVDTLTLKSLSRDGILEWIFDTIVENRKILLTPNELSGEDDWLDYVEASTGIRSTQLSQSRGTGTTRTRLTRQKMTSTPNFSRQATLKLSRRNTKDKLRRQKPREKVESRVESSARAFNETSEHTTDSEITTKLKDSKKNKAPDENFEEKRELVENVVDHVDFDPTGEQMMFDHSMEHFPFFIIGDSNSGKSIMAAMIVKHANTYLPDFHIIPRFCGASDKSRSFFDVLESIYHNLTKLCKMDYTKPSSLPECVNGFQNLCEQIAISEKPNFNFRILVVVDQLEALTCNDRSFALSLNWMPRQFCAKLVFIVTVNKWCVQLMTSAQCVTRESWRFFKLPGELSLNTCQMYLEDLMMSKGRSLTDNQKTLITRSLRNQPTMLLLNSLANQALLWRKRFHLPVNKFASVNHLIQICHIREAEKRFGKSVIRKFCSLICVSQFGLSEIELLDLLSYSDEAVDEVYAAQGVLHRNIVRLPLNWWLQVRSYFVNLLKEKKMGKTFLLTWANKTYAEVFRRSLLHENEECERSIRKLLLDYFMGRLVNPDSPSHMEGEKNESSPSAHNRCISRQQLKVSNGVYNTRAMEEIVFQFGKLLDQQDIVTFYCDFKNLLYLIRGLTIERVIQSIRSINFELYRKTSTRNSILTALEKMLEVNRESLADDSNSLSRVLQTEGFSSEIDTTTINKIKNDAIVWFQRSTTPLMMPVHLEKEECNQNEDFDPTGKIKPTSIVKLDEDVQKVFSMSHCGTKLLRTSTTSRKFWIYDSEKRTCEEVLPEEENGIDMKMYNELLPNLGLIWNGSSWQMVNECNWTLVKFPQQSESAEASRSNFEDFAPRLIPSALGMDCIALQHQIYELFEPSTDQSQIEEGSNEEIDEQDIEGVISQSDVCSVVARTVVELFSFKTREWLSLPHLAEWESSDSRLLFTLPFFASFDNLVVASVLSGGSGGGGSVVLQSEETEWVIRDPDDLEDEESEFEVKNFEEFVAPIENEGDQEEEAVVFREEAGDDEFAVRVIDEKPQTTAENELNEAEFDFGDDDHFANDEIEPSLSPGAWKKVSVTKRRMLKFNDLLEESQLPILYANILTLFAQSSLILVDLVEIQYSRVPCDEVYDTNFEKGFILMKNNEHSSPFVYSVENQKPICFIPEKHHFLNFVPNQAFIIGQKGTKINFYKWNMDATVSNSEERPHFAEHILELNDELINPQICPKIQLGSLILFTEMGMATYDLDKLLGKENGAEIQSLYEVFFEADSKSESRGAHKENHYVARKCCGNFIITAQRDRILIHQYLKDTSTCAERQSISIAGNEFCCDILRLTLSDDGKMLSKIYFATATNDEILLNTFDCSTGSTETYEHIAQKGSDFRFWTKEHLTLLANRDTALLMDTNSGRILESFKSRLLLDFSVAKLGGSIEPVFLFEDRIAIGGYEKTLSSGHVKPSKILSSSLSSASNVVVTVQLEDQKKISVFLVSRMATEIAEYTLTFKGSVLAVSNVTSTKILIAESNKFHVYDTQAENITSVIKHSTEPLMNTTIHSMSIDQSDFRTALCLSSTGPKCYLSLIDTTTGKTITRNMLTSEIAIGLANQTSKIGLNSTNKHRLITLEISNPRDGTKKFVFASNSATEDHLNKIKLDVPNEFKTANLISAQFSPLFSEISKSTRPVDLVA